MARPILCPPLPGRSGGLRCPAGHPSAPLSGAFRPHGQAVRGAETSQGPLPWGISTTGGVLVGCQLHGQPARGVGRPHRVAA
eukprot:3299184-Alexandrium_andersonii.AAC.1